MTKNKIQQSAIHKVILNNEYGLNISMFYIFQLEQIEMTQRIPNKSRATFSALSGKIKKCPYSTCLCILRQRLCSVL